MTLVRVFDKPVTSIIMLDCIRFLGLVMSGGNVVDFWFVFVSTGCSGRKLRPFLADKPVENTILPACYEINVVSLFGQGARANGKCNNDQKSNETNSDL